MTSHAYIVQSACDLRVRAKNIQWAKADARGRLDLSCAKRFQIKFINLTLTETVTDTCEKTISLGNGKCLYQL